MGTPYHHAVSSAKRFGGKPEDYQAIHDWFDASKEHHANITHRMLRHHSQGIAECERVFGTTITNSDGKKIPVKLVAEQHVKEDFGGFIPSLSDWCKAITPQRWMFKGTISNEMLNNGGTVTAKSTLKEGEIKCQD